MDRIAGSTKTQTDAIARQIAQAAGRRRQQQNFFPSVDQLRNARDVGREVVRGYESGRNSGSGDTDRPIVVEINSPVQIDRNEIGRIVDEILVERDQNGETYGSYARR